MYVPISKIEKEKKLVFKTMQKLILINLSFFFLINLFKFFFYHRALFDNINLFLLSL